MRWPQRHILAALALALPLSLLTVSGTRSAAGIPASPSDGLSGTWQISRLCLTICVSPKPVLKTVRHWHDAVFETVSRPPQILYRIGTQVLVHGPKDSLVLTILTRGMLMSGSGVGADGSTFDTTWRCVTPAGPGSIIQSAAPVDVAGTRPAVAPLAMTLC
jgi:hypothetical protein